MTTQPETAMVERVSRIEGVVEQVNLRLAENHDDIQALTAKIDAQGETLSAKIDAQGREFRAETQTLTEKIDAQGREFRSEMNARFNTVYVLIGGVWATMIGGFVAILLRL